MEQGVASDDEDDVIDEEQLDEYRDMVEQLGSFPVGHRCSGGLRSAFFSPN